MNRNLAARGLALALAALVFSAALSADAPTAAETELKAAIVSSFASFVEWPAAAMAPDATLVLCVVNDAPLGEALDRATRGRTVGGHKLAVTSLAADTALPACQLIYVGGRLGPKRALDGAANAAGVSAFTIGDAPDFVTLGGMVRLFRRDDRLRFEVNLDAIQRSGLKLNARVLVLAEGVGKAAAR